MSMFFNNVLFIYQNQVILEKKKQLVNCTQMLKNVDGKNIWKLCYGSQTQGLFTISGNFPFYTKQMEAVAVLWLSCQLKLFFFKAKPFSTMLTYIFLKSVHNFLNC